MMYTGLITKHTGSNYVVRELQGGKRYNCTIRGKLRLKDMKTTNPIAVGDQVEFEAADDAADGVIAEILPRRNYIIRRASNLSRQTHVLAANIDVVFLVITIESPRTSFEFVDRFLVTAEAYKIPVRLVVNKIDLYLTEDAMAELEYFKLIYLPIGYEVIEVSAKLGAGMDTIRERIPGKISLFAGNSGVGKSTLLNALAPGLSLRTGSISEAHHKGKHTTTFYEMFEVLDGFIIDSPGIKGFGLVEMDRSEIYHFFPELFRIASACRFGMCSHTHEPGCAVKEAVEDGRISESRYFSYLKILEGDEGKYR